MATIEDALGNHLLEEWRLPEHLQGRDPLRPLYLAGEFFDWIDSATDLYDVKNGSGRRSPFEHLEQTFADFRCSKRPGYGDIKCVMPQTKRIWSMHSPFLRVVGRVPAPNTFVGIYGVRVADAHGKNSQIDTLRDKTLEFAKLHELADTIKPGDFNALFP